MSVAWTTTRVSLLSSCTPVFSYMEWKKRGGYPHWCRRCLKKLVEHERRKQARKPSTILVIIDAQSVNNTDTAHIKGDDAGKKVSGIKRHIAVDTHGLPYALHTTAAHGTDRAGALEMVAKTNRTLIAVQIGLADSGYTGHVFHARTIDMLGVCGYRLPNEANSIPSRLFRNGGLLNGRLPGWRSRDGCLRIVNGW